MKKVKKEFLPIIIIIILIMLDQLAKVLISNMLYNNSIFVIKGILKLTYIENTGGAFGIGENSTFIFIIINIIIISILIGFLIKKISKIDITDIVSISMVISGGIGNLIDRIFRGYVIDYIDITPIFKYPVFNFADILIVVGVLILIIHRSKDEKIYNK